MFSSHTRHSYNLTTQRTSAHILRDDNQFCSSLPPVDSRREEQTYSIGSFEKQTIWIQIQTGKICKKNKQKKFKTKLGTQATTQNIPTQSKLTEIKG